MSLRDRIAWCEGWFEENYQELDGLPESHHVDQLAFIGVLQPNQDRNDPRFALAMSIIGLIDEAFDTFTFGLFQASIMVCGGVVERIINFECTSVMNAN